jgi:O-antigen/teichoic acid export membrane protein
MVFCIEEKEMKEILAESIPSYQKDRIFIAVRFLAEFTARAGGFVTFPLLARSIGSEGYGVQAQLGTINGILIPIAALGLGFTVVRVVAGRQSVVFISTRFLSSLLMVTVVSIGLAISVALLAQWLNDFFIKVSWATPVVRWSSLMIILTAWELTINDYYRARLRIVSYSLMQIFQTMVNIGGLVLVLLSGGGLLQVVWMWLAVKILFIWVAFGYFVAIGEIRLNVPLMSFREITDLLRFGWPIVVMGISACVMSIGDRAVIGYYLTSKQVGVYNAAYSLAGIFAAMGAPFWGPLYPLMAAHKNNNDLHALALSCRRYTNGYCFFSIPTLVGLTVLASPLLQLLGTEEFAIHPIMFGLIAMGLFSDQFSANVHYLVYLHNEPVFLRNIMVLSGVVNLVLNILTIPFWGIFGAALSTLVSYVFLDFLLFRRAVSYGYRINELYDFHSLKKYGFSAFVMALIIYFLMGYAQQSLILLIGLVGLGIVIYAFILLAMNLLRV